MQALRRFSMASVGLQRVLGLSFGVRLFIVACAPVAFAFVGCASQRPQAAVSSPKVFTMEQQMLLLQNTPPALGPPELRVYKGLEHYFATRDKDFADERRRVERMLDGSQRAASYATAIRIINDLQVSGLLPGTATGPGGGGKDAGAVTSATPGPGATATTGPSNSPAATTAPGSTEETGATPAETDAAPTDSADTDDESTPKATPSAAVTPTPTKPADATASKSAADLLETLQEVEDSPFDRLDRVAAFYLSSELKYRRQVMDSRSADLDTILKRQPKLMDQIEPLRKAGFHEYMLQHQVSVDPGNEDGRMVGVRVQVIAANGKKERAGEVQILRLHPDRAYDTEPTSFAESLEQILHIAGAFKGNVGSVDVDASGSRDAQLKAEARRRFVHRIPKHGSYIDAASHTYGWNFYPSNIEVIERPIFARLFGWLFGTPAKYGIQARLEPGGRDAMVFVLVPDGITSITFVSWSLDGPVEDGEIVNDEPSAPFTVELVRDRERNASPNAVDN